jgi:beta-glucosidase
MENLLIDASEKKASVTVTVRNTGKVAGAEVVQVYVKDNESSLERPEKELKGFSKVFLQPGESKEVKVDLPESAFQYYDDKKKQWVLEPGTFTIKVGNSSANILLEDQITL